MRADERLLVGGDTGFGIDHIERRHGTHFQLLAIVGEQLVTLLESVLLGLHVLVCLDQAPVNGLHLVHGVENLLPE